LTVLPVIPPRSRPFIVTDSIVCDDDLTISYSEIIKVNNNLHAEVDVFDSKRQKYIQTLIFRVKTLFDNTAAKARHTNSRPLKGIKERICGKDGLIRNNLLGKRTNFSARTVIGPDPSLRLTEIGIPIEMADNLTYPEHITKWNIDMFQEKIYSGEIGTFIRHADSKPDSKASEASNRIHVKYALKNKKTDLYTLRIGDIVHRKLENGDYVLTNRQPTLHKGSMLAKRVVRLPSKTIRLNLATTSTFNADFDGDEMNLFVPQSITARTELQYLSATNCNLIGAQSSTPVITIVQDVLLAAYLMTKNDEPIPKEDFFQLIIACDTTLNKTGGLPFDLVERKLQVAQQVYPLFNKEYPVYCGKILFSMLLPDDFNYNRDNLHIHKGVIVDGFVTKKQLKGTHHSFISILNKNYSSDVALHFINNVQFLGNAYMLYHGFSIGISDCLIPRTQAVKEKVLHCFTEATYFEETVKNDFIREAKINMTLSKAKDIGMKLAKESLDKHNNFISTVSSGSKGDFFNIAQIMGLLGQQNVAGKRIPAQLNKGRRTLHSYPMEMTDKEQEFESRGFIRSSFLKGLTPQEFWFHAMSGREGISDTAMKTANSGYIQRKMVKIMEDVQVKYDHTVRNSMGTIIQFAYGADNLCGTHTSILEDGPFFCNVASIADRLNTAHALTV
jgi:DNA-directed RNA polymerase beta' subunit